MRAKPDASRYFHPVHQTLPFPIEVNTDSHAERCRFACGLLACDVRPFNPLLESLPSLLRAPVPARSWRWLRGLLDAAIEASDHRDAGQEAMLAKLSELMFVEALRAHIDGLPPEARSWVAGLRDPDIGKALRVIHGRYAEAWTMEHLAREVGMSRSSFAERFTSYVGVPPMTYLGRWRLQVAARLLASGSMAVAQTAALVGYQPRLQATGGQAARQLATRPHQLAVNAHNWPPVILTRWSNAGSMGFRPGAENSGGHLCA